MKVIQVTTSSKGGAGIAALRLHKALAEIGVASAYLSLDKTIDFTDQSLEDPFFTYKRQGIWQRSIGKLTSIFSVSKRVRLKKEIERLKGLMQYEIVSLPQSNFELERHPLIQEADIIHLHWIGDFLDYERFFSSVKKPVVWTFHDMNPFMGIFHYLGDMERNVLASKFELQISNEKKKWLKLVERGVVISPSQWLLEASIDSGVFAHFNQQVCIPNAIDLELFCPGDMAELRAEFDLSPKEKVVLFTSAAIDNARKGTDILQQALEEIDFPLTLLTLGKGTLNTSNKLVKVIPLGFVSDAQRIARCYQVANAYVLPSREDNLPNTMLEALATGTPVISLPTGGMQEHIKTGFNGTLATNMSANALSKAIANFFEQEESYRSEEIRLYAEAHFGMKKQAIAHLEVYNQLYP